MLSDVSPVSMSEVVAFWLQLFHEDHLWPAHGASSGLMDLPDVLRFPKEYKLFFIYCMKSNIYTYIYLYFASFSPQYLSPQHLDLR